MIKKKKALLCLLGALLVSTSLVPVAALAEEQKGEEVLLEQVVEDDIPVFDEGDEAEQMNFAEEELLPLPVVVDGEVLDGDEEVVPLEDVPSPELVVSEKPEDELVEVDEITPETTSLDQEQVQVEKVDENTDTPVVDIAVDSVPKSVEDINMHEKEVLDEIQSTYEERLIQIEAEYQEALRAIGEIDMSMIAGHRMEEAAVETITEAANDNSVEPQAPSKSVLAPLAQKGMPAVSDILSRVTAGSLNTDDDMFLVKKDVAMDRSGAASKGGILPEIKVSEQDPNYRVERGLRIESTDHSVLEENDELFQALQIAHDAFEKGEIKTAIAYFKKAANIQPAFETRFALATAYHMDEQFEAAQKMYVELINEDSSDWRVLNNLILLAGTDATDETIQELKELERFNSEFPALPAQVGMLYMQRKEYDNAAKSLLRAVELDPANMAYRYNFALVLEELGDVKKAIRIYQQLLLASRQGTEIPVPYKTLQGRVDYLASTLVFN